MPVQTRGSVKRPRDESDVSEEEPSAKRPTTPFFRRIEPSFHERARSARKATPTRSNRPIRPHSALPASRYRNDNGETFSEIAPFNSPEEQPEAKTNNVETPQQQPRSQQTTMGWLWNSARRYIPGLHVEESVPVTTQASEQTSTNTPFLGDPTLPPLEPILRAQAPAPEEESEAAKTLRRLNAMRPNQIEDFTFEGRSRLLDPSYNARLEYVKAQQISGSNKRKFASEAEESSQSATPPTNSFRPPSVDDEDDVDDLVPVTPSKQPELLKTPSRRLEQAAPALLKSAMRTGTRSGMTVGFDESTIKSATEPPKKRRRTYADYGPAGHYTGTLFKDPADRKPLQQPIFKSATKIPPADQDAPFISSDPKFNQPNCFGISLEDLEVDEITPEVEAILAEQEAAAKAAQAAQMAQEADGGPPSAPRPSHAELPASARLGETVNASDGTSANRLLKATQSEAEQIEQQRKLATKYKPKNSSGLARVQPARSRSSSPPRGDATTATTNDVPALVSDENGEASDESTSPTPSSQPLAGDIGSTITTQPRALDNTTRGDDGMTDYERELQYDEWAKNLAWPQPQTYVEAGICSAYIDDLLRKKWTQKDETATRKFWTAEFDDVERMMEEAKKQGQQLELVVGDDLDGIA